MKRRVVLVDAQERSRAAIEERLRPLGLELLSLGAFAFPYQGWDEHNTPHLVIVSTDGALDTEHREFITKMLAHEVKVIIVAGKTDWAEARNLFLAGAYDVLTSSISGEDLTSSVQSALG